MCGPMRGAVIGAMLYEGWAGTRAEAAENMAAYGSGASSRPATTTTPSAPWRGSCPRRCPWSWSRTRPAATGLRDAQRGPGQGAPLRRLRPEVLDRLRWMRRELAPALGAALRSHAARSTSGTSSPRRCRWATRATTATGPPPRCCSRALARRAAGCEHRDAPTVAARAPLPRGQRPLLPEPVHGGVQGALRRRPRHRRTRPWSTAMARNGTEFGVGCRGTGDAGSPRPAPMVRRPLPARLRRRRRQPRPGRLAPSPRPPASAASPWRRRRPSSVRRRQRARRARQHPADVRHHARPSTRSTASPRSASRARPPASTPPWWCAPGCRRSSTPASPDREPGWAWSAPGWSSPGDLLPRRAGRLRRSLRRRGPRPRVT